MDSVVSTFGLTILLRIHRPEFCDIMNCLKTIRIPLLLTLQPWDEPPFCLLLDLHEDCILVHVSPCHVNSRSEPISNCDLGSE